MSFINSFVSGVGCTSGVLFMLYITCKFCRFSHSHRFNTDTDTFYLQKKNVQLEKVEEPEKEEEIEIEVNKNEVNKFKKLFDKLV